MLLSWSTLLLPLFCLRVYVHDSGAFAVCVDVILIDLLPHRPVFTLPPKPIALPNTCGQL